MKIPLLSYKVYCNNVSKPVNQCLICILYISAFSIINNSWINKYDPRCQVRTWFRNTSDCKIHKQNNSIPFAIKYIIYLLYIYVYLEIAAQRVTDNGPFFAGCQNVQTAKEMTCVLETEVVIAQCPAESESVAHATIRIEMPNHAKTASIKHHYLPNWYK